MPHLCRADAREADRLGDARAAVQKLWSDWARSPILTINGWLLLDFFPVPKGVPVPEGVEGPPRLPAAGGLSAISMVSSPAFRGPLSWPSRLGMERVFSTFSRPPEKSVPRLANVPRLVPRLRPRRGGGAPQCKRRVAKILQLGWSSWTLAFSRSSENSLCTESASMAELSTAWWRLLAFLNAASAFLASP